MKTRSLRFQPRLSRHAGGFTLVELLITTAIILVLAALAVAITRTARTSAYKVADMECLHNLATATMVAGNDNAGRLPPLHSEGQSAPYWMFSRDILEGNGIHKESCYTPSKNISGGAPSYAWWYGFGDQTPIHYVYFANDAAVQKNGWFTMGNVTPPTKSEYRGSIAYDVIIKDSTKAFARSVTDDAWYSVLWAGLCRDYSGLPRVAAIMQNGEALGVNVIYLDGHAAWLPKMQMKVRYTTGGLSLLW